MTRGLGLTGALRDVLAPVAPAVALLTQLGDSWFLLALALLAYLVGPSVARAGLDRIDGARLLALTLGGFAVTRLLKTAVAAPRPPVGPPPAPGYLPAALHPGYEWLVHTTSAGFPSGHAVGATAVWGGLAVLATWRTPARRYAIAGAVVAAVAASRLALGLHYLVDVLAGVGAGLVVLVVLVRVPTAGAALALATGAGTVGMAVVPDAESAAILGAALAATLVWLGVGDDLRAATPGTGRVVAAAAPLGLLAAGAALLIRGGEPTPAVVGLVTVLVGAAVMAVPAVIDGEKRGRLGQYVSR